MNLISRPARARVLAGYQGVLAVHAEGSLEAEKLMIFRSYDSRPARRAREARPDSDPAGCGDQPSPGSPLYDHRDEDAALRGRVRLGVAAPRRIPNFTEIGSFALDAHHRSIASVTLPWSRLLTAAQPRVFSWSASSRSSTCSQSDLSRFRTRVGESAAQLSPRTSAGPGGSSSSRRPTGESSSMQAPLPAFPARARSSPHAGTGRFAGSS